MTANVRNLARERYDKEARMGEIVRGRLREMIKEAVAQLNEVLGEGYIFFTECPSGFYGIYERNPKQEAYFERVSDANSVEGLADAVLYLHNMIQGGVKV